MRRPCGPRGGVARHDFLAATDVGVNTNDGDPAGRVAYGKAENQKETRVGAMGATKKVARVSGGEGVGATVVIASATCCLSARNLVFWAGIQHRPFPFLAPPTARRALPSLRNRRRMREMSALPVEGRGKACERPFFSTLDLLVRFR